MIDHAVHQADREDVEIVLREELARGDAMAETVLPVLRHLVASEDSSLFSDEILARVRGMQTDIAANLLEALPDRDDRYATGHVEALARAFLSSPALLLHLHGSALEWQLTERLQHRLALDPVVSPLLQALVSSDNGEIQGLAMRFLAAQTRWCQSQRRMKLPLLELPEELFHTAFVSLRAHFADDPAMAELAARAEVEYHTRYDAGATRLDLASRLASSLGKTALSVSDAGVALFLSALALGSGQGRDEAVISTHEGQLARLALALCSAGLDPRAVEHQFLALHPEVTLPPDFEGLTAERAAAILSSGCYSV